MLHSGIARSRFFLAILLVCALASTFTAAALDGPQQRRGDDENENEDEYRADDNEAVTIAVTLEGDEDGFEMSSLDDSGISVGFLDFKTLSSKIQEIFDRKAISEPATEVSELQVAYCTTIAPSI